MKYVWLLLTFLYFSAFAWQKATVVSVSCYANPELFLQAGVLAYVSDKAGNVSCKGKFISISNRSTNSFFYKTGSEWAEIKTLHRTVISIGSSANSTNPASVFRLQVKYEPDRNGNISAKIQTIAKLNAQSDRIKTHELEGSTSEKPSQANSGRDEALAILNKPIVVPETKRPKPVSTTGKTPKTKQAIKKTTVRAKVLVRPKPASRNQEFEVVQAVEVENDTIPSATLDSADYALLPCFLSENISYYTFYFAELKGDSVLFTDPFPVERYDNSRDAERLFSKAWGCLSERIIQQLGENRYNDLLIDVNNDLPTGILHLRDTQTSSNSVANNSTYTSSLYGTKAELKNWMDFAKNKNPDVVFVKIKFP